MNAFRWSSAMNVPVQPWSMKQSTCLLSSTIWSCSAWSKCDRPEPPSQLIGMQVTTLPGHFRLM